MFLCPALPPGCPGRSVARSQASRSCNGASHTARLNPAILFPSRILPSPLRSRSALCRISPHTSHCFPVNAGRLNPASPPRHADTPVRPLSHRASSVNRSAHCCSSSLHSSVLPLFPPRSSVPLLLPDIQILNIPFLCPAPLPVRARSDSRSGPAIQTRLSVRWSGRECFRCNISSPSC